MRIHHVTLPAMNPPLVAGALAEIVGGRVIPLPHPAGNLLVYAGDDDGSAIEVWPATTRAGVGQHHTETRDLPLPEAWPHHAYVTFDGTVERVFEVFRRHGWHVDRVHNGPPSGVGFALLRGWLENQTVIELGDRDMREQYEAFFRAARGQTERTVG
jgi:hypothetical protein